MFWIFLNRKVQGITDLTYQEQNRNFNFLMLVLSPSGSIHAVCKYHTLCHSDFSFTPNLYYFLRSFNKDTQKLIKLRIL